MIYLDYSATTPINNEVLDTYVNVSKKYIGNPNSLHKLGVESKNIIDMATTQIKNILKVKNHEVIYTSGSSESNNLALKGIALKYKNRGNHIVTTPLEHSSIVGPLNYLSKEGFIIDIVNLTPDGLVDIKHLKTLINDDTLLVTICAVDSEIGIRQNIEEIYDIVKNYKKCFFHIDATQIIGKEEMDFNNIDLISFSAHKFYGPKGIGCLLKKENIVIDSQINGGKSTSVYRSGTPATPLIVSMSKAIRLANENISEKYNYVKELNEIIKNKLNTYEKVHINSTNYSIPHIINFSVVGIKPETLLHALEESEIYISTRSACSNANSKSTSVYAVTKNDELASYSVRVSLSYLTTKEEVNIFLEKFDECYKKLLLKEDV